LHGSADVVVTHGGYNSLVESMEGGARIVSCYTPRDNSNNNDIEQRMHPERLSRFYPIRVITGVQDMPQAVAEAAEMSLAEDRPRVREVLDFNGAENVQNVLIRDLEVSSNFVKGVTEVKRKVFSNETAVSNDTNGKSRKR